MKSSLLSEVRAAAEAGTNPTLTRSGEYVTNSRGQRLHLRTAQASSAKGLILYVHGIGAHCSRPNTKYFSSFFTTKLNYHYAAFDFHGHGYSEGERGFINTYDDLLDDLSSVLSALGPRLWARPSAFLCGNELERICKFVNLSILYNNFQLFLFAMEFMEVRLFEDLRRSNFLVHVRR